MAAALWILLLLACDRGGSCPEGTVEDEARAARLRRLARMDGGGVACFGEGAEPALLPGGVARLDASWPDPAAAARWAHLRAHEHPLPAGEGCLAQALAQEAAAWQVELELRQALGALQASGSPPFTQAWLEDPRPRTVERWLREHPQGAPGVPASVERLEARCAPEHLP